MLQTEFWHNVHVTAPKVPSAAWWRRHGALLAPQAVLVLIVLALLGGAFLASGLYSRQRTELRLAETSRFLTEFRSGRVGQAATRMRAVWQAESGRQDVLLGRLATATESDLARQKRNHQLFVLEIIQEYGLAPEIEILRQFVAGLATCVRVGSCDRDVAAAQLGPALWWFRDQHWPYFQFEYSAIDLDRHLETITPRFAQPASALRSSP
jgi:hypothetical protein